MGLIAGIVGETQTERTDQRSQASYIASLAGTDQINRTPGVVQNSIFRASRSFQSIKHKIRRRTATGRDGNKDQDSMGGH